MRRNIYDILNSNKIDIKKEYSRLFELFYQRKFESGYGNTTIYTLVKYYFTQLNRCLIRRCISIEDFDETYMYNFDEFPKDFTIDYFIDFCEYTYNFSHYLLLFGHFYTDYIRSFMINIKECVEEIGYGLYYKEGIYYITVKSAESVAVAEIVPEKISFSVLEYNHHKMKGDLTSKKAILLEFANEIEPKRKKLSSMNSSLSETLFQSLNKFIRHNNDENEFIANMSTEELENTYDDIYQLWLLAILELDNVERKQKMKDLLKKVNG